MERTAPGSRERKPSTFLLFKGKIFTQSSPEPAVADNTVRIFLNQRKYESMVIKQVLKTNCIPWSEKLMDSLSQQQSTHPVNEVWTKYEHQRHCLWNLNTSVNTVSVQKFRALEKLYWMCWISTRAKHDIDNILLPLVLLVLSMMMNTAEFRRAKHFWGVWVKNARTEWTAVNRDMLLRWQPISWTLIKVATVSEWVCWLPALWTAGLKHPGVSGQWLSRL